MHYLSRSSHHSQSGVSIIDIMLVFALISLLAGLSTPNISKFIKTYRLRMAISDLSSFMHKAKIVSSKNNTEVKLNFSPEGFTGYLIEDSDKNIVAAVSFDNCFHAKLTFNRCYHGDVIYESPIVGEDAQPGELTIKANGLSRRGFAYITNREKKKYYRVGIISASGIVGVEKWNGSEWE